MKVKELIALLQKHNPESDVVMSSDPEGNSYKKLHELSNEMAELEDGSLPYFIEIYASDDAEEGPDYRSVTVLWPS